MNGVPVLHFTYDDKSTGSSEYKSTGNPEYESEDKAVIIYFHGGGWGWFNAGERMSCSDIWRRLLVIHNGMTLKKRSAVVHLTCYFFTSR